MTSFSPSRSRRIAAATTVLTVIAVVACVLVVALSMAVPEAWWPHTGQAFTTDAHPAHHNPCGLIVGPAKAYCERDSKNIPEHPRDTATGWGLVPASAGVAVLLIWRSRTAVGRRRP